MPAIGWPSDALRSLINEFDSLRRGKMVLFGLFGSPAPVEVDEIPFRVGGQLLWVH